MSLLRTIIVILIISIPISAMGETLAANQEKGFTTHSSTASLKGKHGIELSLGLLSEISSTTEVSMGDVTTKSDANGFIGSFGYTYWLEDDWAIEISAGVLDADATVTTNNQGTFVESAVVIPILLGVKYQPYEIFHSDVVRPYVSASVGPYLGFASNVWTGTNTSVEARSETALGSRLAVGADIFLARWFKLGFGAGYRFITDFENRIGSEKNHSSPEFSASFGFVFGKGKAQHREY
jgi:outer membrane protein W